MYLINADSFRPVQARLLPPKPALFLPTTDPQDDIARFPIRALIGLTLKHNLVTFGTTFLYLQGELCGVVQDLGPLTVRTHVLDDLSPPSAIIAGYLGLSEHSREYLLFHEPDSSTVTCWTGMNVMIRCRAASSTVIAEDLFLDHELKVTEVNL